MNQKRVWIVAAVIAATIVMSVGYLLVSKQMNPAPQAAQQANDLPLPAESNAKGTYTAYTAKALASASGRKVLFFHASWCPQCRQIETDITAQGVPAGMTILKVNYDTETDLKQKYSVTLQTTIVEVDDNGDQIKKFVAYDTPTLSAVVKALQE